MGFGERIWYQESQLIRELDELRSQETNGNYLPGDSWDGIFLLKLVKSQDAYFCIPWNWYRSDLFLVLNLVLIQKLTLLR